MHNDILKAFSKDQKEGGSRGHKGKRWEKGKKKNRGSQESSAKSHNDIIPLLKKLVLRILITLQKVNNNWELIRNEIYKKRPLNVLKAI